MTSLLVATSNQGKAEELQRLVGPLGLVVVTSRDVGGLPDVVEDGQTFEANAEKKARSAARATGMLTLADDSGLQVDALDGAPGVYSARYAGEGATDAQNNTRLLEQLREVGPAERTARFVCVLALADPRGSLQDEVVLRRGECEGTILAAPRGSQGFGYDPLFAVQDGRTMAELEPAEKGRISHRGVAANRMLAFLSDYVAS